VRSSGALEVRCSRRGIEVWRSGGTLQALPEKRYGALAYCLLLLEFLAFVPQGSWGETLELCVACVCAALAADAPMRRCGRPSVPWCY